ncbi:hypothetical protein TBS_30910 [Thermobispora bispora]
MRIWPPTRGAPTVACVHNPPAPGGDPGLWPTCAEITQADFFPGWVIYRELLPGGRHGVWVAEHTTGRALRAPDITELRMLLLVEEGDDRTDHHSPGGRTGAVTANTHGGGRRSHAVGHP